MPDTTTPNVATDLEDRTNRVDHVLTINLEEWCMIKNALIAERDRYAEYVAQDPHNPFWDEQLKIAESAITQFDLT
jgi:hypothetical protein